MDGDTALHIACRKGHVGIVNLLLDNGASLNVCNIKDGTCLQAAAKTGKSEVVFAMIKHPRYGHLLWASVLSVSFTQSSNLEDKRKSRIRARVDTQKIKHAPVNKLTSVFYASVLLLIMNFVITLSK